MKNRIDLHKEILNLVGVNVKVYYQPPSSVKITYPCVIYKLDSDKTKYANDIKYIKHKRYSLTIVTKDADSELPDLFDSLTYCKFDRMYMSENLYHYVYTIYY